MDTKNIPGVFLKLQSNGSIRVSDVMHTQDGFWVIFKSVSDILADNNIHDFPASEGTRLACDKFFDDWFLYAVDNGCSYTYSLLKMREQEFDSDAFSLADGDTPGVTISFVSFKCDVLIECLSNPTDASRQRLEREINRVVALRGVHHHNDLKKYFVNPSSDGAYLVAELYVKYVASLDENGVVNLPERYKEISKKRTARLARFIESINQTAGYIVCDNEKIYIKNIESLTGYERAAILATHTGNTSEYSFAAEVEYHARFLTLWAKIKIPFLRRSLYDSAIRADMSVGDGDFSGPAPFYNENSKIVKKQRELHGKSNVSE